MDGNLMDTRYPDSPNANSIQQGLEFQDFVMKTLLAKWGVCLQNFSSAKYQFEFGENIQGWEIKLDNLFLKTGRLSIEIAEKSRAANAKWVASGIYRDDNAKFYVQGNFNRIYVFHKKILVLLHKSGRYEEKEELTVRAFYLPLEDADKFGERVDVLSSDTNLWF
jgi:hypothetical protein